MTFVRILALLVPLFLLLLHSTSAAEPKKKECIEISRGKELKEKLATHNVLLVLGEKDKELDGTYRELCSRLEATPMARVKDLEIAFVKDSNLKRNVMNKAEPPKLGLLDIVQQKLFATLVLGAAPQEQKKTTEISYPEYVLFKKQNSDAGIRFVGGPETNSVEDDSGDEDVDNTEDKAMASAIATFLSEQLQTKKIGSYVYALGSFDMVAAQVMKYETGSWQQKLWAYGISYVLRGMLFRYPIADLLSTTTPVMDFEKDLIDTYQKICKKVVEKGKNYPKDQIKRLQDMLDNDGNSISEMKRESLSQRVHTLKKFSEPEQYGDKEVMAFLFKIGMNVATFLLLLVLIPMIFMASPDDEEEVEEEQETKEVEKEKEQETKENKEEDEKEGEDTAEGAEMEDPDEDDDQGDEAATPPLSKKEKRAQAIQRAKESMKEDKENVQRVLRKRGK